jgi:putative DNA primase/helicase
MLKHHLTFYDNCKDTKPKAKKLGFDEFVETFLLRHDMRSEKDGPMYSGAILTQYGTRSNKATKAVSMGILDFDNADPEQVKQTLVDSGFRAVVVTTHSHTPATPCFRVVIPFKAPVPANLWPHTFAAFNEMFDGAIDPQTKSVSQAFYLPSCTQENSADAFAWSIKGEVFDAIDTLTALGHDCEENDEEETVSRVPTAPTGSSSKACPRKLAEEILSTLFNDQLKFFNFEFYAYRNGYWHQLDRHVDVEQRVMRAFTQLNVSVVKQIVENLQSLTFVREIATGSHDGGRLLCLNNGTLDLATGTLLDHDPEHNLVNKMDVDWNPEAKAPIFMNALNEIFQLDLDRKARVQFILEWFGYCLVPDVSQHKFLWLVGSGGNGKSVLLNTLAVLLGKDNVSYAMLERMGKPSVRAELQGKLCNISPEMNADATLADGYLKAVVAGDWIEAEKKFQPSFSFQPFARVVAATNSLPYLKDTTDGFFRRAIILELTRKFTGKEVDKHLQNKILSELDGILVLAVNALMDLRQRDEFIIPESAIKTANRYRDESDSVRYFVRETCKEDSKGTKPAELYEQYQRFAARFRFPALNLIKFGKQLSNLGIGSRDSNGNKFWLVAATEYQRETYTRTSLEDAMN